MSSGVFPSLKSFYRHGHLKCPDCTTVIMTPFKCEDAVIDKCPQCQGIWFDSQEIGVFKTSLGKFDYSEFKIDIHTDVEERVQISHCPRCPKEVLGDFIYSYNSKVTTQMCSKCKGLWLPLKEVALLIDLSRTQQLIEPHLRGMAEELRKSQHNISKYREIGDVGRSLMQPVYYQRHFILPIILPFYDNTPRKIFPIATVAIIALNILTYFSLTTKFLLPLDVFDKYALVPANFGTGSAWKTLITHMFFHVGILHVFGNMFFLWMFGDNVEETLGTKRYIALYFFSGLIAALTHILLFPSSTIPALGASGAISGIMGSYLLLYPRATVSTFIGFAVLDIPAWLILGFWIFLQIVFAVISAEGGVAWGAHVGGFFGGIAFMYLLRYLKKSTQH